MELLQMILMGIGGLTLIALVIWQKRRPDGQNGRGTTEADFERRSRTGFRR